jgi:diguanylate cyclase (GGDEF)-like protein
VDARLETGLRAALAAYADELANARRLAEGLATDPLVQAALAEDDAVALRALVRGHPALVVRDGGGDVFGDAPPLAGSRRVNVVSDRGALLGSITGTVALDGPLLRRLRPRAALEPHDALLVLEQGRVAAGPVGLGEDLPPETRNLTTIDLDGTEYRALSAALVNDPAGASLAVASPTSKLAAATAGVRNRLLEGVALSLLLIGLVAYFLGRSIVGNLSHLAQAANELAEGRLARRVPARGGDEFARLGRAFNEMAQQLEERVAELELERNRLRDTTARLGEALAATHDPDQLLRVVVETAVEATGAAGGVIVDGEGHLFQAGLPKAGATRLELPLNAGRTNFGTLFLSGDDFDLDDREIATSLAAHAVIALENARLHRIVERQALVDGLTGLANRRSAEETLDAELARAERFATPLAIVFADLDDFKAVNDTHGHAAGDAVLRRLADVLRATLREIDLAARWGGEEFALVLPGTDLAGALRVAERVRERLAEEVVTAADGAEIRVTASLGVAAYPDLETAAALLEAADAALYEAKRAGKNRVQAAAEPAGHPYRL